jgi:hypothetical protein
MLFGTKEKKKKNGSLKFLIHKNRCLKILLNICLFVYLFVGCATFDAIVFGGKDNKQQNGKLLLDKPCHAELGELFVCLFVCWFVCCWLV